MRPLFPTFLVAVLMLSACQASRAHIVLDQAKATPGAAYRATFRVGHGCDGAATTAISVRLPEGLRGARPQPKPGWQLSTKSVSLATATSSHGRAVTEALSEVTWTVQPGAAPLEDAWFDEFVIRAGLPSTPGELWFKVRQTCGDKHVDWAEMPSTTVKLQDLATPAVRLVVSHD